jgi:hypothetical protein
MSRGQTTAEFKASHPELGGLWPYYGGNPGDPGWVSDKAREVGDREGLDAEALDDEAAEFGWEFHDPGYGRAIEEAALRLKERGGAR